ncbi:LINE-1 reverse transcriptase-like [Vitis vinifera]|uniref:LINE-1 reverse transcriptase-like n=1 Tax=Vitis vinifera TaxID=29760 RepID=A0A438HCS7_VITVI|nr:LINE-1 reverse transcriptase-like [Vitis vinifera]
MLAGGGIRQGPTPFRFENMWLKAEGFIELVRSWWQGIDVRGSASYKLATKMKEIKQKLKVWNREVFGKLECNKSTALQQVELWDREENERIPTVEESELKKEAKENDRKWVIMEETHWRQLLREIWLKEGDRNTGFFHRMTSVHRRNNFLERIKINGEWFLEEQEIREGIANAFKNLLSEDTGWKADIGSLQLDQISQQEAVILERPFTEDEIHVALMDMNGDKAPGPDGFTLAFGKVKSGAEDLGEFRPISLLGGLYKLLAKVLANRLKIVVGKVVSTSQNAFVRGRQILDTSLIANEVIDSWQKRKEKGLICKLDIEKVYDSINWKFLLKVLQKMGFGPKWVGWMWSCLSSTKFSVLVNGVPASFFPNSKGLRQGDPLSPYLFVMGMEVLDVLIRRAVEGGFLSKCNIRGDSEPPLNISHLFFADDTIIFCEARKDHLTHLSWILFWFEAASSLRINLAKSEIIPIGEVVEMEELAVELGCRVGSLPSQYLGLPLGALNRAPYIMPKIVARRLEKVQRDFLWGGGNMEGKTHLVNWEVVCTDKDKGGLGLRKLAMLNKALLGKWIWRFACDKDNLWKQVIKVKYGQEDFGWRPKKATGAVGVRVWKEISKESEWCWDNMTFRVGKGNTIRFWTDVWCSESTLSHCFPHLFGMAVQRNSTVEEMWDQNSGQGNWNLNFLRDFNDWELELVGDFLHILRGLKPSWEEDSVLWRKGRSGQFKVKEAYNLLARSDDTGFPSRSI